MAERAARRAPGQTRRVKPRRRYAWGAIKVASSLAGGGAGFLLARGLPGTTSSLVLGVATVVGAVFAYVLLAVTRGLLRFCLALWYRMRITHWQNLWARSVEDAIAASKDWGNDAQALTDLGIAHYLRGDNEQAVSYLTRAQQASDGSPAALNSLAAAEAAQQQWERAGAALVAAVQFDPDNPHTLGNLATLVAEISPGSALGTSLYEALPEADARALNNLAVHEIRAGNLPVAIVHLQKALSQRSRYPYALANLGVLDFRDNELDNAVGHLDLAVQWGSNNPEFLSNLAGVLATAGDLRDAERVLKLARRLDSAHEAAHVNQGCLHADAGRYEKAVDPHSLFGQGR